MADKKLGGAMSAEDTLLIDELLGFDEGVDRKHFLKNREIYVKKLNHLKARQKMSEKLTNGVTKPRSPGRKPKITPASKASHSSDEEEEDEEPQQAPSSRSTNEHKLRRRTVNDLPPPLLSQETSSSTQKPARSRRSIGGVPVPAGPIVTNGSRRSPGRTNEPSVTTKTSTTSRKTTLLSEFSSDSDDDAHLRKPVTFGTDSMVSTPSSQASTRQSYTHKNSWKASEDVSHFPRGSGGSRSAAALPSLFNDVPPSSSASKIFADSTSSDFRRRDFNADSLASRFGGTPTRTTPSYVGGVEARRPMPIVTRAASGGDRLDVSTVGGTAGSKWHHVISKFLCVVPVVVFIVLAMAYLNLRLSSSFDTTAVADFMACEPGTNATTSKDCLSPDEVTEMKKVISKLLDLLGKRAGEFDCEQRSGAVRSLNIKGALGSLDKDDVKYAEDFSRVLTILLINPSWQIRFLDDQNKETTHTSAVKNLESERASMGLICRVQIAVSRVFFRLCLAVIGCIVVLMLFLLIRGYRKKKEEELRALHHLVEDIIGVLKNHTEAYKQQPAKLLSYLPIAHVRDSLIPLKDRKRRQSQWERAVTFLSANESRVREEIQQVDGEEMSCWKWIETYSDQTSSRLSVKQTVLLKEKSVSASGVTSLGVFEARATSSCLKLLNMLPPGGDVDETLPPVRDAILDRCGTYHGILDVSVDSAMQDDVFVKCVSESAAGQNYKSLHGWSYKGRIVSAQYITSTFYRALFPDSQNAMVPLRSAASASRRQSFGITR